MRKYFFLILVSYFICDATQAQRLVSDAIITYHVQVPEGQASSAMFNGSSFVQSIRGNMSRIDMNFNIVNYSYIINTKDESYITLITRNTEKFLIHVGKQQYEKDIQQYEAVKFVDKPETKRIAGYNCHRATASMLDGQTFDVYYTPDLVVENKLYNRRFMNLKGIPLEFEMILKGGGKIRVVATSINLDPVPASVFDVPKGGYKEITEAEMKQLGN
ncbi:hypothetical protein DCM91_03110 [Chitinophaga costaii]|nr:hypothetical protein DCM91_03110 [Chitinophaga costaii]